MKEMKKEYVTPQAEKLDFDYKENVVASNGKRCGIIGMTVRYSNPDGVCEAHAGGDE